MTTELTFKTLSLTHTFDNAIGAGEGNLSVPPDGSIPNTATLTATHTATHTATLTATHRKAFDNAIRAGESKVSVPPDGSIPVHTHTLKHTHAHTHTHTHTHTHSNLQKGVRQCNRSRRKQSLSASRRKYPKRTPVRSHTRLADSEGGHAAVLSDECLFHPSLRTPARGSNMPHLHAARRDCRHVAGKQKVVRQCAGLSSRCQRQGHFNQLARPPCLAQRDCCVVCCCN